MNFDSEDDEQQILAKIKKVQIQKKNGKNEDTEMAGDCNNSSTTKSSKKVLIQDITKE